MPSFLRLSASHRRNASSPGYHRALRRLEALPYTGHDRSTGQSRTKSRHEHLRVFSRPSFRLTSNMQLRQNTSLCVWLQTRYKTMSPRSRVYPIIAQPLITFQRDRSTCCSNPPCHPHSWPRRPLVSQLHSSSTFFTSLLNANFCLLIPTTLVLQSSMHAAHRSRVRGSYPVSRCCQSASAHRSCKMHSPSYAAL